MIELIVGNSESTIKGLDRAMHSKLAKVLSYETDPMQAKYAGHFGSRAISLLSKKGVFPTGLLYLALGFFKKHKIPVKVGDKRVCIRPNCLYKLDLGFTPYPEQEAAVEAAIKAHRGIIVAPTGVGKSAIIALLISKLQTTTLIVVPTLELKRQLTESLRKAFGADKVGSAKQGAVIAVENIDSLDPKKPLRSGQFPYACVIIDEFHHSGAKSYRDLNKKVLNETYFRFGLTATPFRSQDHERLLLESVLSKVIYRIDYKTAVAKGYIVPMEAYFYEVPRHKVTGKTWKTVYNELVVNNTARNNVISGLLLSLRENGASALCLVKEIAHGNQLSELSKTFFANGQDGDSQDLIRFFNEGKIKQLIGTTGILGEGVDTKPTEFVIIAGLGKSKNAFMQQVGRAFRNYPGKGSCKVILFYDPSHKWTREHFKAQLRYLEEEYGVLAVRLELT